MAYVGTPKHEGGVTYTIASILEGEAGTQGARGMQAVANVMMNRARINFGHFGTTLLAQALAHDQFQGQSRPSEIAIEVANAAIMGSLSDITHGALYYANPHASSAAWARRLNAHNALQIGAHFFTDNTEGHPFPHVREAER